MVFFFNLIKQNLENSLFFELHLNSVLFVRKISKIASRVSCFLVWFVVLCFFLGGPGFFLSTTLFIFYTKCVKVYVTEHNLDVNLTMFAPRTGTVNSHYL